MIDIYPPDITLGGFDIRQHGNTILITLPNGNNPNTTEQKIVPTCKRYATENDLWQLLLLAMSLFRRGDEDVC